MNFKTLVKSIQIVGYNGARMVYEKGHQDIYLPDPFFLLSISILGKTSCTHASKYVQPFYYDVDDWLKPTGITRRQLLTPIIEEIWVVTLKIYVWLFWLV